MLKTILVGMGIVMLGSAAGAAAAKIYLEKHPTNKAIVVTAPLPKKTTVKEHKQSKSK